MTRCLDSSEALLVIVTLVLNDPDGLSLTVSSLENQLDGRFAHVIVDGGSGEPTLRVITSSQMTLGSVLLPGPDSGIYEAMNRSLVGLTDEQWVLYLNAGDRLSREGSTRFLLDELAETSSNWAFAPVIVEEGDGNSRGVPSSVPFTLTGFAYGRTKICHQAAVARVGAIREVGLFRTDIPNCADFDLLLRLGSRYPPLEWDQPFSIYRAGGGADQDAYRVLWRQGKSRRQLLEPTGVARVRDFVAVGVSIARVFIGRQVDRLARTGAAPTNWRARAKRHNRSLKVRAKPPK